MSILDPFLLRKPTILIIGAGNIGVFLGTKLAKIGCKVILLGREKLRVIPPSITIQDNAYQVPVRTYEFPQGVRFDFVFLTSKLYDLHENLTRIQGSNIAYRFIISIQNGLVDPNLYKNQVDTKKFTSISIFEGFQLQDNTLRVNESNKGWITEHNTPGKTIARFLNQAGIHCTTTTQLDVIKAEKMLMNCCVNLLSAIRKKKFKELFADTQDKNFIDLLFDECYTVLRTIVDLRPSEVLRNEFYHVVHNMDHYSSTYQDVQLGKRTEADFLNGYIIQVAHQRNIPVPYNEKLWDEFQRLIKIQ